MKGRQIGQCDVTIDEMQQIKDMTDGDSTRREIAEKLDRSANTIWRYQKLMGLI
jgi:hypothetical protein